MQRLLRLGAFWLLSVLLLSGCSGSNSGSAADGGTGTGNDNITINWTGGTSFSFGSSLPFTILVVDGDTGQRLSGVTVTVDTFDNGISVNADSSVSDNNGEVSGTLTATTDGARPFTVNIRAEDSNGFTADSDSFQVSLLNPVDGIRLSSGSPEFGQDNIINFELEVTDTANTVMPNQEVSLVLSDPDAATAATLTLSTSATNGNGIIAGTITNTDATPRQMLLEANAGGFIHSFVFTVPEVPVTQALLTVLASDLQLLTGNSASVTITALVKNSQNVVLPNEVVIFSATSGSLSLGSVITDENGIAEVALTNTDPTPRNIIVTASNNNLTDSVEIAITGTTLSAPADVTVPLGDSISTTFTLSDSTGAGLSGHELSFSSQAGNTITADSFVTGPQGEVSITVTGDVATDDIITATALSGSVFSSFDFNVSGIVYRLEQTAPVTDGEAISIVLVDDYDDCDGQGNDLDCTGKVANIRLTWSENGTAKANEQVRFTTNRGVFTQIEGADNNVALHDFTTNVNGIILAKLTSITAGPAVITAESLDGSLTTGSIQVSFLADEPAEIFASASPSTVSAGGETSKITATVRDANGNLVEGQQVTFTLQDNTGGSIEPASAITDAGGVANTTYTSNLQVSGVGQVEVTSTVKDLDGNDLSDTVPLTVGNLPASISLGTGNTLDEPTTTSYEMPWVARITDPAGNPIVGAEVSADIINIRYFKGFWWPNQLFDWVTVGNLPCANEDINLDSTLSEGEDINGNDILDPGNSIATAAVDGLTDENGEVIINIRYAQQYARWLEVKLQVSTVVQGSEDIDFSTFVLPVSADDIEDINVSPPGVSVLVPEGASDVQTGVDENGEPIVEPVVGRFATGSPFGLVDDCTDPG